MLYRIEEIGVTAWRSLTGLRQYSDVGASLEKQVHNIPVLIQHGIAKRCATSDPAIWVRCHDARINGRTSLEEQRHARRVAIRGSEAQLCKTIPCNDLDSGTGIEQHLQQSDFAIPRGEVRRRICVR